MNRWGQTALHWAARCGDGVTVSLLLKSGAQLGLQDADGETALQKAIPGTLAHRMLTAEPARRAEAHIFDGVASRLASKFHVYCLDVRGRGETEWGPPDGYTTANYVSDLEAVRAALGLERMALVGTSMGGLLSMYYAPVHPERVTHVVLNDIGPELAPPGIERIMAMLREAPQGFTGMKAVAKYYRDNNPSMLSQRSDDEVMEYARWHVRKDMTVLMWKMDPAVRSAPPAPPPADPWESFKSISSPVMIVRGGASDLLAPEGAARMVDARPGTKLVEVPGVGHAPALVEPAVYGELEAFLGS
jgi:pimeloyl-ACP methyl ester carboxylesterase